MSDTVIEFRPKKTRPEIATSEPVVDRSGGVEPSGPQAAARHTVLRVEGGALAVPIEIDALYPAAPGVSTELLRALDLLAEANELLERARIELADNAVSADRSLQRLQLLLPRLFFCRRIGDGFATIINSLHFSFVNQKGKPLSAQQVNTVWRTLRELRTHPFLSMEQAIVYVSEMEEAGLEIDPSGVSILIEGAQDE